MKQVYVVVAALVAGLIGGIVGARLMRPREQAAPPQVIRARAFELVDEGGRVISYWGIDKNDYAVLAFGSHWPADLAKGHPHPPLQDLEHQMVALGVAGDGPFLHMRAPDGTTRVWLDIDMWGKPSLLMGDETGTRMSLGILRSDTPGPQDNNWALDFSPDRASIGMYTVKEHGLQYVRGSFSVSKEKVEYPGGQPRPPK
jgi:hypothetical protein